jgi:hypothetical protein
MFPFACMRAFLERATSLSIAKPITVPASTAGPKHSIRLWKRRKCAASSRGRRFHSWRPEARLEGLVAQPIRLPKPE